MTTIFIENLVLQGVHGVTAKERERSQPFRVDISTEVDVSSESTDKIDSTVDYRLMKKAAETVICQEQHTLLETIAARIASIIREDKRVCGVKVTVRKLTIWESGIPGVTIEY